MSKTKALTVGQQIRAARKAAGFTQVGLSEAAGWSQYTMSALESGKIRPSIHHLIPIARWTGCSFLIGPGTLEVWPAGKRD